MKGIVTCILVLWAVSTSIAQGPAGTDPARKERCPACGMFVSMFVDWNSVIEFKDARRATFDGSKCMFKYYLDMKKYDPAVSAKDIKAITVKDYYSKASIDARQAFYVIWSDMYGPMGHEPIPFEKEKDANKFLREHKGKKILKFNDITMKLIVALDNP